MKKVQLVTTILEIIGLVTVVVGAAKLNPYAGMVAIGAVLVLLGYALGVDGGEQ